MEGGEQRKRRRENQRREPEAWRAFPWLWVWKGWQ